MTTETTPVVPYPPKLREELRPAWLVGAMDGYAARFAIAEGTCSMDDLEQLQEEQIATLGGGFTRGPYWEAFDAGWQKRDEELSR